MESPVVINLLDRITLLTHPHAKDVVLQVISHFNSQGFDLAAKLFTPDAIWHVVASPPSSTWGGNMLAIDFCIPTQELIAPFEEWFYTAAEIIVDTARNGADGTVVVSGIAKGFGPGTHRYEDNYLMKFTMKNGKVVELKQVLDAYAVERRFATRRAE